MYTEILQSIDGIGIFPVISLVLFFVVFGGMLIAGPSRRPRPSRSDGRAAAGRDRCGQRRRDAASIGVRRLL